MLTISIDTEILRLYYSLVFCTLYVDQWPPGGKLGTDMQPSPIVRHLSVMMKSLTAMQLLKIFIFFRLYKLVILMIKIKIICEGIFLCHNCNLVVTLVVSLYTTDLLESKKSSTLLSCNPQTLNKIEIIQSVGDYFFSFHMYLKI